MPTHPDPLHADFAWLASAQPLMSPAYWASRGAQAATWRPGVPASVESLNAEIRQVGRRFEWVHRQALEASADVELLASNVQIRGAGRTLGELDVLYRHNGEVVHREIAVKYYLAARPGTDPASWVGPGRRDRLSLKLDKLCAQQLELPRVATAAGVWPAELPYPDRSEALVLGALFAPEGDPRLPEGAHPKVERGSWWFASEFAERYDASGWCELPRPKWLSPEHVRRLPTEPAAELAQRVHDDARPRFVGCVEGEGVRRGFVVPDGWWDDVDAVP